MPAESTLDRDYFMAPDEAKSFGIIDEIIKQRPIEEVLQPSELKTTL